MEQRTHDSAFGRYTPPESSPDTEHAQDEERYVGRPGKPVRALAFSGGIFDAAMQLGAVHALLAIDATPPEVVVGLSTGAINAVAAAEILRAGEPLKGDEAKREARVARFRQILEAFRQSPEDVLAPFLPDIYQVDAAAPLQPTDLPIHERRERVQRFRAARARAGLIKLMNDLLRLHVSIGSIARGARACLGLIASAEVRPAYKRWLVRIVEGFRLWRVLLTSLSALAPVGLRLCTIALRLTSRRVADAFQTSPLVRDMTDILPRTLVTPLMRLGRRLEPAEQSEQREVDRPFGANAGGLIFRGWMRRKASRSVGWLVGVSMLSIPIVVIPYLAARVISGAVAQGARAGWPHVAATGAWQAIASAAGRVGEFISSSRPVEFARSLAKAVGDSNAASYVAAIGKAAFAGLASAVGRVHHWLDQIVPIDQPLHHFNPMTVPLVADVIYLVVLVAIVAYARRLVTTDTILDYYGIRDALLDPYPLRSWFVRLFDPTYYGETEMDDVVERALTRAQLEKELPSSPRTLADYATGDDPMLVGPMATNVADGSLTILPDTTPVVEALVAATAMPPFFQAQPIPRRKSSGTPQTWYIDGAVVANEPTGAVATHLSGILNPKSSDLEIYTASSLPLSTAELGIDREEYSGLVDSARRALRLQSLRDATLDRRMTELVTRSVPASNAVWTPPNTPHALGSKFVKASVHAIELDRSTSLNERLLRARDVTARRNLIAESVADGCRSTMQVILETHLVEHHAGTPHVKCRAVVEARIHPAPLFPGAEPGGGPGLPEVCRKCVLHLRNDRGKVTSKVDQAIAVPTRVHGAPLWPTRREAHGDVAVAKPPVHAPSLPNLAARQSEVDERTSETDWPRARRGRAANERPTVSLLFSGGVFRGVFLVGVVNGLNELGIEPDVIAGSSIGSITAAMAARVFCEPKAADRHSRLARLAATYLAVDRLVLTDRFSDFIRTFTLRAGATEFSLRDLDTAFRAFDRSGTTVYGKELRRVLAGLERLLYVSPFEARDLVEAFRMRRYDRVLHLLGAYTQEWLERGALGSEVLGSEPLQLLIRKHVLDGRSDAEGAAEFTKQLQSAGMQFIASATNLTWGRLDTLHIPPTTAQPDKRARLVEALLASSAFPAVFRPRWTWEVLPEAPAVEQFIDGGVMDNLPLDAVARFLNDAREAKRLGAHPKLRTAPEDGEPADEPADEQARHVPHLLFTGSLEVERTPLSERAARYTAHRWPETQRRAKELSYNNKVDGYAATQRALRAIWFAKGGEKSAGYEPLGLEVIAVKPQWLCGTFAFHPMLGFRRSEQAKSIAHGCRSTLAEFQSVRPEWLEEWGLKKKGAWFDEPSKERGADGGCWYRQDCKCPFSAESLGKVKPPLPDHTKSEVARIHTLCGKSATHERKDTNALLRAARGGGRRDARPSGEV